MSARDPDRRARSPILGNRLRDTALPGAGGLRRIASATRNSLRGVRDGVATEAAIRQEVAVAALGLALSSVVATSVWVWAALIASLLLVLTVEFLNTALERLCNHVMPERHEAIRVTKDLASAGVFFALVLAGLIWGVATLQRVGLLG